MVDISFLDDEEADSEHDQVSVSPARFLSRRLITIADRGDSYVPWDFGKTKYSAK